MITGVNWFDPVIAILVALFILKESYNLLNKAFSPLLDTAWKKDDIEALEKKLDQLGTKYHSLRTRIAGNYRFIEIHVEIPEKESVGDAHKYCDMIEDELMSVYENLSVTIHVEPK
jgi:divalent metal cation (Fe/Co/Zn/Cd) transporter